jgi:hypothetical protein
MNWLLIVVFYRAASDAPTAEALDFRPVFQQLAQDVVKSTSF